MSEVETYFHTFTTDQPELLSTDPTPYACFFADYRIGESGYRIGGQQITTDAGGIPIGPTGKGGFWYPYMGPGQSWKLNTFYVVGQIGDTVEVHAKRFG